MGQFICQPVQKGPEGVKMGGRCCGLADHLGFWGHLG